MAYLNKNDLIKRGSERKHITVPVPELGGDVMLQSLTSRERDDFERESIEQKGDVTEIRDNLRARLVAKSIVDPDTKQPMFNAMEVRDLGRVRSGIMDRLYQQARDLSDVSDEDVERMVKASEPDHSPDSGTR